MGHAFYPCKMISGTRFKKAKVVFLVLKEKKDEPTNPNAICEKKKQKEKKISTTLVNNMK